MDKNTIILVVVAVILAISLMSVQLQTGENKNLINNSTNGSADGSTSSSVNSTVRQLDNAYLQWADVTFKSMRLHVSDVANATKTNNYSDLATIGTSLKRDAEISLNQSRYLDVSPGLKLSLEDIQKSLDDYVVVGEYIETGGKTRNDTLLMNAASYAKNASDHMTNASVDVQNYMRTLK